MSMASVELPGEALSEAPAMQPARRRPGLFSAKAAAVEAAKEPAKEPANDAAGDAPPAAPTRRRPGFSSRLSSETPGGGQEPAQPQNGHTSKPTASAAEVEAPSTERSTNEAPAPQPTRRRQGLFSAQAAARESAKEPAKERESEAPSAEKSTNEVPAPQPTRRRQGLFSAQAAAKESAQEPAQESTQDTAGDAPPPQTTRRRPGTFSARTEAAAGKAQEPDGAAAPLEHVSRHASGSYDDEEPAGERLWESAHGFAGALFGEALQGALGDSDIKDLLGKVAKAEPVVAANASYAPGQKYTVIGTIMRRGESLESPKIVRLEPGTDVEVLEVGSGPTGKRIKVISVNGHEGWISVVSGEGVPLLTPKEGNKAPGGFIGDLIGSVMAEQAAADAAPAASAVKPKRK